MSTISIQVTAVLTGAFLSGAMMSLCFIAVPVLLDTATEASQLLPQWARMYYYGHQIMPTIAVGTLLLYCYISFRNKRSWRLFALAGVTTVSIAPFTWIFMVSTNDELFRLEASSKVMDVEIEQVKGLVVRWTWLHFMRSLLPLAGAVMGALGIF
ncbi:DUF1772-domain-containing protein [Mollisia scopiformis]|uniref:DUF1772-domain-containing protein n=1 Tax=Mollisia scopiformis TaxID=149040 RepID=A0A194WUQ2_MOLSC|nr:DUF1772-domain-containing protein [Mollisia scopiformis]KUJ11675.1 DUF1772-domain-containing protein [Mollisia scopiformis]